MTIDLSYDFIVVGGGMSGLCAAIAAARGGAKTALVQDRPVLGGNASSEIRMHICGADRHAHRPDARETGILEEILLEHKHRNPCNAYPIFDSVLWEKAAFQENLTLYLNTRMLEVETKDGRIQSVLAEQMTTEKRFRLSAPLFADATGDAALGEKSGAHYRVGRESRSEFGEGYAPEESDSCTMGNSLMFHARDMGHPVPFIKPFWANTYTEDQLRLRDHSQVTSGYWWVELGGGKFEVIRDGEVIRDELLKAVFGVWDQIKNGGDKGAENLELDWVGFLPGKRESRRLMGPYVLNENDCWAGRRFDDAVAYGGWPMDVHTVEGFLTQSEEPTVYLQLDDVYTIPYRCLYSENIRNLFLAGRAISCTHMAFASTRVMGTCAVAGQAVGTAAAIAAAEKLEPAGVLEQIDRLQQTLLRDDCYIPGIGNTDPGDLARSATITASCCVRGCEPENVANGVARPVGTLSNCWSAPVAEKPQISLKFPRPAAVGEVRIAFDSNLSREITISISDAVLTRQSEGTPPELVRDYTLEGLCQGKRVFRKEITGNYQRHCVIPIDSIAPCDELTLTVEATNGSEIATVYELRVYEESYEKQTPVRRGCLRRRARRDGRRHRQRAPRRKDHSGGTERFSGRHADHGRNWADDDLSRRGKAGGLRNSAGDRGPAAGAGLFQRPHEGRRRLLWFHDGL